MVSTMPNDVGWAKAGGGSVAVVAGIDTHAETHTVAVLDQVGVLLGHAQFPASPAGYGQALAWIGGYGRLGRVGVEGTGCYGVGVTARLLAAGVEVVEVNRPNRQARRSLGKSDPVDAEQAARAVLAGTAAAVPKTHAGPVESIRVILSTRKSAVRARTAALNGFHAQLVTAPEGLRARLETLRPAEQLAVAAGFRPVEVFDPANAVKQALRRLARRVGSLTAEIAAAEDDLKVLVTGYAPELVAVTGVGVLSAAQLLVTAGANPDRFTSRDGFVAACGASPVPASSGRTDRHRLNRGGDRAANSALHMIAVTRMRCDAQTRRYAARRRAEGKSTRDILRCLKRYLARRLFGHIAQAAVQAPRVEPGRPPACPSKPAGGEPRLQGQGRPKAAAQRARQRPLRQEERPSYTARRRTHTLDKT